MRTTYKFLLFGILFGFMFPIMATIIELNLRTERPVGDDFWSIHTNDPLIMIIDTAPFFLGLFAYFIGQRQEKNEMINRELEMYIEKLQNTQGRLIEQEAVKTKLEMSKRIAHELKNPLNFIINFSEVSIDLIEECKFPEPENGERSDELEALNAIRADLQRNLTVINQHGKRSGKILNQMLNPEKANN